MCKINLLRIIFIITLKSRNTCIYELKKKHGRVKITMSRGPIYHCMRV